jgi:ubiquinone/menaquinone biosynthesis C-methylase UbiE
MHDFLKRVLEPEVMDTWDEAVDYDAMDFLAVNTAFSEVALALVPTAQSPSRLAVLDAGTGTARIPILINQRLRQQQLPLWQITAIDLAASMLKLGSEHLAKAGLEAEIQLAQVDAKQLPYPDASFDLVISNSIVHHLPDPFPFLQEVRRVLKPNGGLLLRDLLRPAQDTLVQQLVAEIGPEYNPHQQQLFADSLRAAFTLPEIQTLFRQAGFEVINHAEKSGDLDRGVRIYQSSDRHWTAEQPLHAPGQ